MNNRTAIRKPTILEESPPFPSPDGELVAHLSSLTSGNGNHTQVTVSHSRGGSGLACVGEPRVALGLRWADNKTLVVRYPGDLSLENDWQNTFGHGGHGRAVYEPVSRDSIAPIEWTVSSQFEVVSEKELARGRLITIAFAGRRIYDYSYYDSWEPDSSAAFLASLGLQAGGETWAGMVRGLIEPDHPKIMSHLELDPEGDGIAIRSSRRSSLLLVADRIAEAKRDPAVLNAALEWARKRGQLE
jgi:hypothetical protein